MKIEELKNHIFNYLRDKKSEINNSNTLWALTKGWCLERGITMGGSYASWQNNISVSILHDKVIHKFNISISDL